MRRVRAAGPFGLVSVLLISVASGSWACVPQPFLSITPLASGPVGAEVTVEGTDFESGTVEIRWDGVQGPVLAKGTDGEFSMNVIIPEAPVGLHLVIGLTRDANGNVTQKGATSFEVTEAGTSMPAPSTELGQAGDAGAADDSGLSVAEILGISMGALAMATLGGLVGAAESSRRHRSTPAAADASRRDAS